MGYCMRQLKQQFFLPKENVQNAYEAVKTLHGKESIEDSSGYHFSWVSHDFYKLPNFEEIMKEWRWKPTFDEQGNVTKLTFTGEKFGDDIKLFNTIAPFVQTNSFIEMRGEDGAQWTWTFQDNHVSETFHQTSIYDDEDYDDDF